jgi:hypothetical protein
MGFGIRAAHTRRRRPALTSLVAFACGGTEQPPRSERSDDVAVQGWTVSDQGVRVRRLALADTTIARSSTTDATQSALWLWPPIIDSHVHLSYWPVANELANRGVAAVVDLAAPESSLTAGLEAPLTVISAGC